MLISVHTDILRKNSAIITLCAAICGFLLIAACGSAPASPGAPPATPGAVNLNKTELTLIVGDSDTLIASIKGVSWVSDNEDIALADDNGRITAMFPGTATITASSPGNKSVECVIRAQLVRMVQINGGTFRKGSPEATAPKDEQPQHEVTVGDFNMGIYPITQAQYRLVMGDDPSQFKGDDLPVEQVSWYEALMFCNKLSMLEGLSPAYQIAGSTDPADWGAAPARSDTKWNAAAIVEGTNGYRLPTESQWEYACRAGTSTFFNTGVSLTADQSNYDGREPFGNTAGSKKFREQTTEVDTFAPNPWGLYDMHGNVWEWCWDWHALYTGGTKTDPQGADNGAYRIARGGSWRNSGRFLRSASRGNSDPSFKNVNDTNSIGFRLVRP